ncbi:nuclear transport factor 2 family protein [Fulvivirgaceae bacterium BMA10]|uniref:Nuclear transport factor 2 family protein n=1 Tax=Splendidivirga corallicola TaxID=3051826 RepID=A0ABT8KRX5_9BACT|nr:nuclear transport factor 2 family protein [Fulvivirgaceae bacterium BMA10]
MKVTHIMLLLLGLLACCTNRKNHELENLKDDIEMKTETAIKNKESVRAFFKALENESVDQLVSLFADDAKHINPYASGLFPEGADGKEEIRNYWTPVFPNFDGMEFPIEELYAMEDPSIVFVKYIGKIKLKNDAGLYENSYYSTFKFNEAGLITEYVEIFNPIVAARGFGLIDKIK